MLTVLLGVRLYSIHSTAPWLLPGLEHRVDRTISTWAWLLHAPFHAPHSWRPCFQVQSEGPEPTEHSGLLSLTSQKWGYKRLGRM